jgi:hypothetical protein
VVRVAKRFVVSLVGGLVSGLAESWLIAILRGPIARLIEGLTARLVERFMVERLISRLGLVAWLIRGLAEGLITMLGEGLITSLGKRLVRRLVATLAGRLIEKLISRFRIVAGLGSLARLVRRWIERLTPRFRGMNWLVERLVGGLGRLSIRRWTTLHIVWCAVVLMLRILRLGTAGRVRF